MKQDNIIQLLLVNDSENDAVETTNQLRNDGLTLRPKIISNADLLDKEIGKKPYDIILFTANISGLSVGTLLQKLKEHQSDAAVIVIGDHTPDETLTLMKQGVCTVIPEEPEELVTLSVKKEFSALKGLRSESILTKQLEDSEKRCQQLIDSSRDAIAYVHEGMHILSNDPYYKMFGYESRDDIEAMPLMDLVSSEDGAQLKEFLRRYSQYDKMTDEELQDNLLKLTGIKDDESEFQIQMEFQPASMSGEECIQIIIRNEAISSKAQAKLQEKLADLNIKCQETGLYNRRYFLEYLEKTVEQAVENKETAYLLYISLDKFNDIREQLGVINSDQVIVDIANLIKNTIDDETLMARFESYRFSAIIKTDDEKYALECAEKIRNTVDEHIATAKNKSITTTCSIGITVISPACSGAQNTLNHVQSACETARENGGNQVHQYVPDTSELNDQQLINYWANEIENAIKQKRLFLVFQPFVSLLGEETENFELFIRMRNEQGEIILPKEFLPPAEASNHSIHIDRWIVSEAISKLSEQNQAGNQRRFIIKLTSASLNDDKFMAWLKHNLERYEVKPEQVIFQVKAHQAAEHLRATQELSKEIRQLGCQFALEHFGLEENAFTLLKHIKVDLLKLDIELVQNISSNPEKLEALNTVCSKANELEVKSMVPFVEEASSLSVIWQSGAQYIQGAFLQEASESLDFDFSSFA